MARGFADIQRNSVKEDSGYQTIFEKVTEATGGEKQSYQWYRNAVRSEISAFKKDNSKYIKDELRDRSGITSNEDGNILRRYAVAGHMYMFEYKATSRLPYYDKFPLIYCIKATPKEFFGANLHYMTPKKRIMAVRALLRGRIDLPKSCFHKYLKSNIDGGYLLDLHADEWDTAILLPVEDFVVQVKGGQQFSYDKETVWEETNEKFYDKIKARRIIQGYGHSRDREMVK